MGSPLHRGPSVVQICLSWSWSWEKLAPDLNYVRELLVLRPDRETVPLDSGVADVVRHGRFGIYRFAVFAYRQPSARAQPRCGIE